MFKSHRLKVTASGQQRNKDTTKGGKKAAQWRQPHRDCTFAVAKASRMTQRLRQEKAQGSGPIDGFELHNKQPQ